MKLEKTFNTSGSGKILFISDIHYNHPGILRHNSSTRPFQNTLEMNKWLVDNVWSMIKENDIVFDLGDTFWNMKAQDIEDILRNVKGTMYKIVGNHDSYGLYHGDQAILKKYYAGIFDLLDIKVIHEGIEYMCSLSHYPLVSWNHKPYGCFNLHGHCHGNIDNYNENSADLRIDVGIDGRLAQTLGTPLIDFRDILKYFQDKIGENTEFRKYVISKCTEL